MSKKKGNKNKKDKSYDWLWVVLIIFAFVLILVSLYQAKKIKETEELQEKKKDERLKWLTHRQNRLGSLVDKKLKKKKALDRLFTWMYFSARLFLVGCWSAYVYWGYVVYHKAMTAEQFLAWNGMGALYLTVFIFLVAGVVNIAEALKIGKTWLKTWVYGKYLGIDDAIKADEDELGDIEKELDDLN